MPSPLRPAPILGDAYLVPAGATGAWSSHVDSIAVWTARGWSYIAPKIGYLLYVENQLGYYHYAPSGSWVAGIGTSALGSGTVLPASLLGGKSAWQVENQTTNAPPGSPADGVQYIIGPARPGHGLARRASSPSRRTARGSSSRRSRATPPTTRT
jgi:hypothetical protein